MRSAVKLRKRPERAGSRAVRRAPSKTGPSDGPDPTTCTLKPEWIRAVERAHLEYFIADFPERRFPEVRRALLQVLGLPPADERHTG